MRFSLETLRQAFALARGRCECTRDGHAHSSRCDEQLTWNNLGFLGEGGWQAHAWVPLDAGGEDDPENCEVLCWRCEARLAQGDR